MEEEIEKPIVITVHKWRSGDKYTCRACQEGVFEALEAVNYCPACDQPHMIKVSL